LIDYEEFCGSTSEGRGGETADGNARMTVQELKELLEGADDFVLLDVRNPNE